MASSTTPEVKLELRLAPSISPDNNERPAEEVNSGSGMAPMDDNLQEDEGINNIAMASDEASALKGLGLADNVRDQDELEKEITNQANLVMIEQEDARDLKRIEKANNSIQKLEAHLLIQRQRMDTATTDRLHMKFQDEVRQTTSEILALKKDIKDIEQRVEQRHQEPAAAGGVREDEATAANQRLATETQREFLIRTGKITPFSRMPVRGPDGFNGDLTEALMDAEEEAEVGDKLLESNESEFKSHQNLRLPGFADVPESSLNVSDNEFGLRQRKRRKLAGAASNGRSRKPSTDDEAPDIYSPDLSVEESDPLEDDDEDDEIMTKSTSRKRPLKASNTAETINLGGIDDGNEQMYQSRLKNWVEKRSAARRSKTQEDQQSTQDDEDVDDDEWFKPCPDAPDHHFDNGIKLPGDIYPALFDYQKTGVQWLGELYNQQVGGIIGDEMGLGKTIQMISFLAGLHYSKKLTKPIIVVAPATVLRQWVNEFHRWWPPLRVSILHSSGTGMLNVSNEGRIEEIEEMYGNARRPSKSSKAAQRIVERVVNQGHVLVTTYAGLQTYSDILVPVDWDYAVLDEGHKIRNPNTAITINCKELRTANRVILSGTPMQNNLIELWSLFDFVFPMRLGTLVNFRYSFEVPIKLGGYANATNAQILTATKCAETLKSAISPYLLQRLKVDVASDLPKKSEQVLFCKLTRPQRDAYEAFLASGEMASISKGQRNSLFGIDILRKICNHPDLLEKSLISKPGYKWGSPNKSGKMQVVKSLLEMWKRFGHKTLLFSQGVQMLDIIEEYVRSLHGFNYIRMDGKTNVKDRQTLVDRFNNDPDLHVFLLTTKVGGLGVNLTGANRVIIFDPDWNPSTDVQARERAWRLGQKKEVTIYRLMTAGTIEEKIYHRQIFKQFLTNKILKDPKQRQTFQMKDLHDLFSLGASDDGITETGEIFKEAQVQFANQPHAPEEAGAVKRIEDASTTQIDVDSNNTNQVDTVVKDEQGDDDNEVHNITGIAGIEQFHDEEAENQPSEEDRLMEGIFAGSGVHSALEHDHIINGLPKYSVDRIMLEREAKAVAASAAAVLLKAGEAAKKVEPGTVTWTGEFGSTGRPINHRRAAGPSSANILAGLSSRQGLNSGGSTGSSRSGTPSTNQTTGPPPKTGIDFIKLIREFIIRQGGSAPSQMLVNHFNRMCKTPQQSAEFKYMLGEIARLERSNSRMRGRWFLKDAYK